MGAGLETASTPEEMRDLSERWRASGQTVGLVPTMGALHEGHLSLVRRARSECERVVVSIFVNPTQFGRGEDFETYPRDLERDRALLAREGADAVFSPTIEAMYGEEDPDLSSGGRASVDPGRLGQMWEGEVRPGHFRGVATIVTMLFGAVRPHRAYFGEKDYQQLVIVRRMARELQLGVEVVGCPTVREEDGLAMSSRNVYLSPEEREAALSLSRALGRCAALAREGERSAKKLEAAMLEVCGREPLVGLQYAAVVDAESLERLERLGERPARAIIAARVGRTHLIDNAGIP